MEETVIKPLGLNHTFLKAPKDSLGNLDYASDFPAALLY